MSLLGEIQQMAVDGNGDLETLLRKCRILAARLKNEDFKNWVQWELDGYRDGVDLPDYRIFHTECLGHFSGYRGSGLRNAPIPESLIPPTWREPLTTARIRQGVGEIKNLIDGTETGSLTIAWPADTGRVFGDQIYQNLVLVQAWQSLGVSTLVGILSTVRNRILNFVLEIEGSFPDAGEAQASSVPFPKEQVSQIFNHYIYGNVGNMASGQHIQQSATVNVNQGDFRSLTAYLETQGIKSDDLTELKKALEVDGKPPKKGFGKSVSKWLGTMVGKAAEGSWEIATGTAAGILTEALKSYYGM